MCYHGQHATTMGARCITGTRKPRDGFPKTDLGLCHQYRYRTGTKNSRGNAMGRAWHGTNATTTKASYMCKRKSKQDIIPRKTARGNPSQDGTGDSRSRNNEGNLVPWGHCRRGRGAKKKTQPDVGALQRQIQKLLDEKEQTLERDQKNRQELATYQTTIGRMREEIRGLRRTVAGSGFSIARLKNEKDTKRRANEEVEHRNHSLRKELRRAGQKLLDLGV